MTHIVVDPVTRIEGHLRIEAEVDGGRVTDAWSSATMFRGIELILKGRDPRDAWAFTQRICGVCTTVHAIASIRERLSSEWRLLRPQSVVRRRRMVLATTAGKARLSSPDRWGMRISKLRQSVFSLTDMMRAT